MDTITRPASVETRRPRDTLSLRTCRGRGSSKLDGGEHSPDNPETDEEQLTAALYAERNRWDIDRRKLPEDAEAWLRGGGFAAGRRLDKSDADKLWNAFLGTLAREVS